MQKVTVKIVNKSGFELPKYETEHSVGLDVKAFIEGGALLVGEGKTVKIPTRLYVAIPEGFEIQVRSRSGLAAKHEVSVLNSPGTIDPDYRGEIIVILRNNSDRTFSITHGDRIGQLVLSEKPRLIWEEVEELPTSDRGEGGLGSTGTK